MQIQRAARAALGAATFAAALIGISAAPPAGAAVSDIPGFEITSLGATGCTVVDVESVIGDSAGGIVTSADRVFTTGDSETSRTNLDQTGLAGTGYTHHALAADLETGIAYVLGDGGGELAYGGGTATRLIALDQSGTPGASTMLSSPVPIDSGSGYAGIFSGYGAIVLVDSGPGGQVTVIEPSTGNVTVLGNQAVFPTTDGNESWAIWGIAEKYQDGTFGIVYAPDPSKVVRTTVPNGATSTVQSFTDIGDDADITASVAEGRWYLKNEYSNQFGSANEAQSSCPATFIVNAVPSAGVAVSATAPTAEEGGDPGVFTFTRTGDTSSALTIGYQVSGSATPGEDYAPFGLVSFQAGQSSVTKEVVAVDDGTAEDDESVIVTLLDGSDYDVAAPISATVTITDALPEPDPCDGVADPGFTDVPASNVHAGNIACLGGLGYAQGGPGGRPADEYGPRVQTTRGQMASFIARIAEDLGVELPADPEDAFTDDDESVHELRINQLAAVGVIGDNGEAGSSYRPGDVISREEMASFLNGLIEAVTGARLITDQDFFGDDGESPYEADINGLASVGIVEGPGDGNYDPDGTVQRDSMASFLVRTLQYLAEAEVAEPPVDEG